MFPQAQLPSSHLLINIYNVVTMVVNGPPYALGGPFTFGFAFAVAR